MKKVITFTAKWCSSCRKLHKKLGDVSTNVPIEHLDYDKNTRLFGHYKVRDIPTMIMFQDEVEIKRLAGSGHTIEKINEWFNS